MQSYRLWAVLGCLSLFATAIFIFGFGYAVRDMLFPTNPTSEQVIPSPSPESAPIAADQNEIRITAIGDSLTKGTGDSSGEGYVRQMVEGLKKEWKKPIRLINNLAVNGMRADQLAKKLKNDKGMRYALQQSNLILLTIGGNDLFQFAMNNRTPGEPGIKMSALLKDLPLGLERLEVVFAELNRINPDAQLVYVGLYNPFYDLDELRDGSLEVQQWNKRAYEIIHKYPQMQLVPTFDLFEKKIGNYMSSDHFHPNHEGYKAIAERIIQSL
ncbi:MAG: GDSL-type esterase/lipase family protein [Candidatus Pristimantibacillus sp.]